MDRADYIASNVPLNAIKIQTKTLRNLCLFP